MHIEAPYLLADMAEDAFGLPTRSGSSGRM